MVFAQRIEVSTDSPIISFTNEQEMLGYSQEQLFQKSISYPQLNHIAKKKIHIEKELKMKRVTVIDDFLIYSAGFAKHPIGNLSYSLTLDVEDQKYHYCFDKMKFQPFERNRYGRFVAANTKTESIESIFHKSTEEAKIIEEALNKHLSKETEQIKVFMAER